jgi:hypothetical protein
VELIARQLGCRHTVKDYVAVLPTLGGEHAKDELNTPVAFQLLPLHQIARSEQERGNPNREGEQGGEGDDPVGHFFSPRSLPRSKVELTISIRR